MLEFLNYADTFDDEGDIDYQVTAEHIIGVLESSGLIRFP